MDSKEGGKDQLIERCVTFLMKPTATNMTTIEALDKSRKSKTVKIATKKKSSSSSKKRKVTEGYFGNLPTLQAPLQFFAQASFAAYLLAYDSTEFILDSLFFISSG